MTPTHKRFETAVKLLLFNQAAAQIDEGDGTTEVQEEGWALEVSYTCQYRHHKQWHSEVNAWEHWSEHDKTEIHLATLTSPDGDDYDVTDEFQNYIND